MENKVRTFIMHSAKEEIIKPLEEAAKLFDNVEIVGTGPHNKSTLQNLSLNEPDVLITNLLPLDEIEQINQIVKDIQIIILTNNANMARDIIEKAQQKNIYNVSELDIEDSENNDPRSVIELVSTNEGPISEAPKEKKKGNKEDESEGVMSKGLENFQKDSEESVEKSKNRKEDFDEKDEEKLETKYSRKDKENLTQAMSLQSKMITFYSLKGGVGTTTLAKETANLYSGIKMPKKVKTGPSNFMKVALIDLDFDKGNMRSHLGFEKIEPTIYSWIEDIVQKLESGVSINQIRYTNIQVLSQYARKINRDFYAFTTGQGGFPSRLMSRLHAIDKKGDLPQRVIQKILTSLRKAFHIVIVDTSSNVDEVLQSALEETDNIALVTEPTITSFENLKVTMGEFKNFEAIDLSKIKVILNKKIKKDSLEDEPKEIISTITYKMYDYEEEREKEHPLETIQEIEYDENVIRTANSFDFVTNLNPTNFKKDIINVCEKFLPIFTVKPKRVLSEAKINNPNLDKKKKREHVKKMKAKKKAEKQDKTKQKEKSTQTDITKMNLQQFIEYLNQKQDVPKTKLGFPKIDSKPNGLPKSTWKKYLKRSTKEINRAKKAQKNKKQKEDVNKG